MNLSDETQAVKHRKKPLAMVASIGPEGNTGVNGKQEYGGRIMITERMKKSIQEDRIIYTQTWNAGKQEVAIKYFQEAKAHYLRLGVTDEEFRNAWNNK